MEGLRGEKQGCVIVSCRQGECAFDKGPILLETCEERRDQRNPGLIISVLPGCWGSGMASFIGQHSLRLERGEREAESTPAVEKTLGAS